MGIFEGIAESEKKKNVVPKKKPVARKKIESKTVKKKEHEVPAVEKKETIPNLGDVPEKKKRGRNTIAQSVLDGGSNIDLSDLIEEAIEAEYREKISKADLAAYKVEKEKLDLDLKAGNIAEVPYMEFVYISHIEKMYVDMLRMIDKIKPKLSPFIQDQDEDGTIKLLKKEVIDTIRNVKKGQKEAVKSWKKDLRERK